MVSALAKKILNLIRSKGFISREALARELGLKPVRVDAALEELRVAGYIRYVDVSCDATCGRCPFAAVCGVQSPGRHVFLVIKEAPRALDS